MEPQLGDSGRSEGSAFGLPHAEEHRNAVCIEAAGDLEIRKTSSGTLVRLHFELR